MVDLSDAAGVGAPDGSPGRTGRADELFCVAVGLVDRDGGRRCLAINVRRPRSAGALGRALTLAERLGRGQVGATWRTLSRILVIRQIS